ncbi:MAG: hypoxanthine phosphoribosyltransferase [Deltaproteobacteria bacterium]|nr:hypoxanthine phosphoribosyltransferase [Deltaproteobacteria bacterium]
MKVLFSEEQIRKRVEEVAQEIDSVFPHEPPIIVGVLNGAFIFTADLVRSMRSFVEIDFIRASSYGYFAETSGKVKITKDMEKSVLGRDVVVVEDILDSGITLNFIKGWLQKKQPRSLRFCVLLDKKALRKEPFVAEHVCFSIDDGFVVGYGLDYGERYRNLSNIQLLVGEENAKCS